AHAMGFPLEEINLRIWNLRGHNYSIESLADELVKLQSTFCFEAVFMDPMYKLLQGRDENSARDISDLVNTFDALAENTSAAIIYGAHFSKGNQAAKESIDRISGSGVFG